VRTGRAQGRRRRALPPGRNAAASPFRFELDTELENWFLEDEGYELAVFHSHVSSPPRPSRTDVENIGLWEGRPYLILSLGTGDLAAWRIAGRRGLGNRAPRLGRLEAALHAELGIGQAPCR
jgi:proteasome lid subunit RPN8/RPN11